jgi:ADP-heptose:LPS heptosyltransferase
LSQYVINRLVREMPEVRRILVARFGAIGDLLLTTPALRALASRFPGAEITYIVSIGLGELLRGHPAVTEIIEFDKRTDARPGPFLALAGRLRERRFDLYVNFQRNVKTVLFGLAAGAPRTVMYRRRAAPQRETGRMQHAVENFLATLAPLGIDVAAVGRHLDFHVDEDARQQAQQLLRARGLRDGEPLLLVNPGASAASRQWPAAHLAELLDALRARRPDIRIGLVGGPADLPLTRDVLCRVKPGHTMLDLVAACGLKQLGALMERAGAMLTMDTGPMHIAAAVGTPIVLLLGPTSADRIGPPMPSAQRRPGVPPIVLVRGDGLDCIPCNRSHCRRGDQACITGIAHVHVIAAVEAQFARLSAREPAGAWQPALLTSPGSLRANLTGA